MIKKIIISNGWSDDNKGDSAIVEGLIDVLRARGAREISIVSSFSADSVHFTDSTRHLERKYALGVFPHPVFHRCPFKRTARLTRLMDTIKALILLAAPRIGARWINPEQRASLEAIRNADLVVGKGGHYLFGTSNVGGLYTLFLNAYTLLLAKRLGVKTALSANSVGPFVGGPARAFARYVFQRIDNIQLRERKSLDLLTGLGISGLKETYDTAFVINEEEVGSVLDGLGSYIVITSRQWDFPYDPRGARVKYENYVSALVGAALHCHEAGLMVLVAPQVIGPTPIEDDRIINKELGSRMADAGIPVIVLDQDFTPGQLKTIYAQARFLIGTRFHSVILALAAGTPVNVISYHGPKAPGIMEQFGLGEYVLDIDTITTDKLVERCRLLLENEDNLRNLIAIKMREIPARIADDVESLAVG